MTTFLTSPILVTGASGHLGRQVVETLLKAGAKNLIAVSRDPSKLADLKARGVEIRGGDFDRPETLGPAFKGAERLLLVSTDALMVPGQRLAQHRNAVKAAKSAGVKHVVYTSSAAARPVVGGGLLDDHFWTEAALFESGLDWTILRDNLYTDLLLMSLPHAVQTGTLYGAMGEAGRAYVTRADCAAAAAGALLTEKGQAIYEIGGPEALSLGEIAEIASNIAGRKVAYQPLPPEAYAQGLKAAGLPDVLVRVMVDFDLDAAQGFHALLTPAVQTLTGRAPQSIRSFLEQNKAALVKAA